MPDLVVTNAGAARLLTAGAQPTHMQFGSGTLPMTDWSGRTIVPGAFKTVPVIHAIESVQLQTTGVDDDDAAAYVNFAALGLWIGDPLDAASVLMAFGTAAVGQTYGDKALDIDLEVSANVTLTAAQLGNVMFDVAVVLNMTDTRYGLGRIATEQEARDANHAQALMAAVRMGDWYDALDIVASKISGQLTNAQIASIAATKLTGELITNQYGSGTVTNSKIVSMNASKLTGTVDVGRLPLAALEPYGVGKLWFSDAAPAGWTILDGEELSRASNPNLFAEWGVSYGPGNGSTTFNKPDFRGRVPVGAGGADDALLGNDVGDTGGERSHALTVDEMPAHTHPYNEVEIRLPLGPATHSSTQSRSYTVPDGMTGSAGGDQAHNNIQPSLVVNFIARLG